MNSSDKEKIESYIKESENLNISGKYEDALIILDRALKIDSNNVEANYEKIYALNKIDKYRESIELCDQILKNRPEDFRVLNQRGIALMGVFEQYEAIMVFDEVLRINPGNAVAISYKKLALEFVEEGFDVGTQIIKNAKKLSDEGFVFAKLDKNGETIEILNEIKKILKSKEEFEKLKKGDEVMVISKKDYKDECRYAGIVVNNNEGQLHINGIPDDVLFKYEDIKEIHQIVNLINK